MSTNARLSQFIDNVGISKAELARRVGINKSSLSSMLNRTATLKSDFVNSLYEIYPNLNIEWLITGEGNMWKDDVKDIDKTRAELLMKIKKLEDRVKVLEYTLGTKENIIARRGVRIEKQEQYIAELEYRIKLMEEEEKG